MSKSTLGTLAVIIIIGLGIWFLMGKGQSTETPTPSDSEGVSNEMPADGATGVEETVVAGTTTYTLAEITTHSTAESCWSLIGGMVYDLTEWISKHPGGPQAILGNLCGKDGTEAFEKMHGKHPTQKPQTALAGFEIGALESAAQ